MENEINLYINLIKQDYINHMQSCENDQVKNDMISRFVTGVKINNGKKYIKIVTGGSVHSFIVKEDGNKFKKGDILKAASWNAPAKNSPRGNIFDDHIKTSWTGAYYL